jgi:two-component system, chemotaxis family, chemotaxis protein CheY
MDPTATTTAPIPAAAPTAKRSLRILYADDLHELRDVARISFGRDGHQIECVSDGAIALERIQADPAFDLLITDHHMPNMNGLELVTHLREQNFAGKIMVFSSELSESIARQYRAQKVDRTLYKPVFPSVLRQSLNELFPPATPAA